MGLLDIQPGLHLYAIAITHGKKRQLAFKTISLDHEVHTKLAAGDEQTSMDVVSVACASMGIDVKAIRELQFRPISHADIREIVKSYALHN